ncbi:unnamed protein product [Trichobilharzia regenti]|nr:unnamed protein product [Trichobilharzia regenti]
MWSFGINDITRELLSKCLYTRLSKPLDLIIRTSGEIRLSDFLTWQASENGAVYKFINSYWPEFSLWDFLLAILHYQFTCLQMTVSGCGLASWLLSSGGKNQWLVTIGDLAQNRSQWRRCIHFL